MTTINQEPTMTTPTPPAWLLCDHRGIGLPGCPTCDGRLDPEARRLLAEVGAYAANLLFAAMAAKATLEDQGRIIEQHRDAEAHGAYGVGPWTKIGSTMPEPWPGCSIEQGGVRMLVHRVAPGHGAVEWEMDAHARIDIPSTAVAALWDGRVCVWRRKA